ncbi:MAG: phenylalanine--tRNA ligase subunit alpha [Eubacteriales bacterium]|nr:phenylalanine--tRNA ligase subunit alpha [Eubacteriales bacterium]
MLEKLKAIRSAAFARLEEADSMQKLNDIRAEILGKKCELSQLLRSMGQLAPEERPKAGAAVNAVRQEIEARFEEMRAIIQKKEKEAALLNEKIDVTMPGKRLPSGGLHPINIVRNDIVDIFTRMGYDIVDGPEIETDYYNFQALNLPLDHPARDMQDTFYITKNLLLRTQTSAAQIRTMEKQKPPIKILSPGRVFRADEVDATHSPVFHQCEGLVVGKGITMCDLKGALDLFAKGMFGPKTRTRFRPSFFPFTEPSVEVDVSCSLCDGKGCRVCKGAGWIEILGAGMVNPKVLAGCGIDPEEYSGFAFGIGLERVALLRYGISDMRLMFENDVRFLNQFR